MTTLTHRPAGRRSGAGWRVPAALLALTAIPVGAGTLRLLQLSGGPAVIPADPRFVGFPVALVGHIVASAVFATFAIVQLVPGVRHRHPTWHRRAGRVLSVCGLAVAASGVWLTVGYPAHPGTGPVLFVSRLAAASAMGCFVVLGVLAIRRHDVAAHRSWMVRAYALGLGAGTQALTEGVTEAIVGPGELSGDLAKLAGWLINLAVAEWAIRRPVLGPAGRRVR